MGGIGLPLTGEDTLRINSYGSLAAVTLAIEGRLISDEECLVPFADQHFPSSNRSLVQSFVRLNDGLLNGFQVRAAVGTPKRGQVFVTAELVRGIGPTVQSLGILAAGYVGNGEPLTWPGTPIMTSVDGPGYLRSVNNAQPGAGADWTITVPVGARWRPIALLASLATSATVATRQAQILLDDGANVFAQMSGNDGQAASLTFAYTLASSNGVGAMAPTDALIPLPDWTVLLAGYRIRSSTLSIQAADQWTAQQLLVEEWIEP